MFKVSYGTSVRKIPCSNHAAKNVRKHLEELRKTDRLLTREHVTKVTYSVKHVLNMHLPEEQTRVAILNTINHVGGDHSSCSPEWKCKHAGTEGVLPWSLETYNKIKVKYYYLPEMQEGCVR
jgi:hypothetical protein